MIRHTRKTTMLMAENLPDMVKFVTSCSCNSCLKLYGVGGLLFRILDLMTIQSMSERILYLIMSQARTLRKGNRSDGVCRKNQQLINRGRKVVNV